MFLNRTSHNCSTIKYTFHQVLLKYLCDNYTIMLLQPRNPPFSAFWASRKTDCNRTVPDLLRRIRGPQTRQIWTHLTTTSEASCWKSTINTSWSLRRLMKVALQTIWEELSQQHQQDGGNLYQALACLRDCQWCMVTSSICYFSLNSITWKFYSVAFQTVFFDDDTVKEVVFFNQWIIIV